MPSRQKINPTYFVIVCVVAVVAMFVGSIVISMAVVQAERAAPTEPAGDSN